MSSTSKQGRFQFQLFNSEWLEKYFVRRVGEIRVGDVCIRNSNARFVILGIEESIGPIANRGGIGAENAFESFLSVFLNTQVYDGCRIEDIEILGSIKHVSIFSSFENASDQVKELDDFVLEVLSKYISFDQIPIVIGGGHNNAYPLIKWSSGKGLLNVINLDPHADCRETNVRHSGNSFSFALNDRVLNEYAVLGLHEAFNNSFILNFLTNKKVKHTFYEDYLIGKRNLIQDSLELIHTWNNAENQIGIEIDMDCIANMPSSAMSPSGWLLDQVRSYLLNLTSKLERIAYLHLPEAAPINEQEKRIVGKALTYLIRDFIQNVK